VVVFLSGQVSRCPKNLRQKDFTLSEAGKHPVILQTVSLVVCLVFGMRKIFRRHRMSKASRRLWDIDLAFISDAARLVLFHVSTQRHIIKEYVSVCKRALYQYVKYRWCICGCYVK